MYIMDKNTGYKEAKAMKFKMKTKPWKHQLLALEYLYPRDIAALYTAPGTGKTKIIIDLIVNRGWNLVLVVTTNKGCDVWEAEFRKHSNLSTKNVLNLAGIPGGKKVQLCKQKLSEGKNGYKDGPVILICNYEGVWRPEFAAYLMCKTVKIDTVVCDESHRIKSPSSRCSWFLKRIGRKVPCRYLVTGTPLAENPMDIYAQYRFLDPSIFGTRFADFKERYQNVDTYLSQKFGYSVLKKDQPYKNLDELHDKMFSCAFLMPSSVKLPKRFNAIKRFKLNKKCSKVYRQLQKEGAIDFGDTFIETNNALTLLTRKRQLTGGMLPVENDVGEKKIKVFSHDRMEFLAEILDGLPRDEPVVIFAQFVHDFKEIRAACKKAKRKCSELSGREDTLADWKSGKTQVIAVQYTSGSESVDLTRARYTIYYGLTNRLALYEQSKKRTHRPGQTRSCYYMHFVATLDDGSSTVDQRIMEAIRQKKDIVQYCLTVGE